MSRRLSCSEIASVWCYYDVQCLSTPFTDCRTHSLSGLFSAAPPTWRGVLTGSGSACQGAAPGDRALAVAFGSAPGVPNWGGLLSRVRKAAQDSAHDCFDILYVVDPARSWYSGEASFSKFCSLSRQVALHHTSGLPRCTDSCGCGGSSVCCRAAVCRKPAHSGCKAHSQ